MRLNPADFPAHTDTLVAVVLGALLATFSGILATQVEAHFKRRERQRDAALLFGELLSTVRILLGFAGDTRNRGEPYGGITLRMLRSVRRELDIYDRNRERLYDIQAAAVRVTLHGLIVRIAMPLEGILDSAEVLAANADNPAFDDMRAARVQGFDFLMETAKDIDPIVATFGRLAHHPFEAYSPAPGSRLGATAPTPPTGG